MNTTEKNLISDIYDYIVNVTIVQKKLLPVNLLYGDGTRWKHEKKIFETVYVEIEKLLKIN